MNKTVKNISYLDSARSRAYPGEGKRERARVDGAAGPGDALHLQPRGGGREDEEGGAGDGRVVQRHHHRGRGVQLLL